MGSTHIPKQPSQSIRLCATLPHSVYLVLHSPSAWGTKSLICFLAFWLYYILDVGERSTRSQKAQFCVMEKSCRDDPVTACREADISSLRRGGLGERSSPVWCSCSVSAPFARCELDQSKPSSGCRSCSRASSAWAAATSSVSAAASDTAALARAI